jgi:hypothetical protein
VRRDRREGIIRAFASLSMDAERINLIASSLADLGKRVGELRRYL